MEKQLSSQDNFRTESEFVLLHEITNILSSSLNLKDTLRVIFELLDDRMGVVKGVLTLLDPFTSNYRVEMAYGLDDIEMKKHSFQRWVTLTEEVLDHQSPLVEGDNTLCLPIIIGVEKMGSLSVVLGEDVEQELMSYSKMLSIVTLMIGQEVRLKRLMESEKEALRSENVKLKDELSEKYNIHNMIGKSGAMIEVYESIKQVSNSNATVLIRGESGTGKELVAHAIHYNSSRSKFPFIKINCGAIPESLIESELFGYEKGAFTDAHEKKIGKFEAASNGTIFLDEVGELSPVIQVKLLRVLQEKEFTRVGGVVPVKVNVRVVTATNRDLEAEMQKGGFREDLYYRLNVFPIFIPPLRERRSDILLLSEFFLDKFSKENEKKIKKISSRAVNVLSVYVWPGNVRELENCMERAVIVCSDEMVDLHHLPPSVQGASVQPKQSRSESQYSLASMVNNYERELILDALRETNGNQSKAAKLLQTTKRIIGYKIQQLGIRLEIDVSALLA